MQAASANKGRQVFNEINITPLTDIFLVLLIIMMVVAPMMVQQRGDIKPPSLASGQSIDPGKLTVEITQDGTFYVEGSPVAQAELAGVLTSRAESLEEKNVIIRADKTTKSGAVMTIFEAARDAGYEKVTVAGEALSDDRQQTLQENTASTAQSSGGMALPEEETP